MKPPPAEVPPAPDEPSGAPPGSPATRLTLLLEIDDDARPAGADDAWLPEAVFLQDWAVHALDGLRADSDRAARALCHELSVRIVGAGTMRALNRDWRGRDAATNVLSFPADLPALPMSDDRAADAGRAAPGDESGEGSAGVPGRGGHDAAGDGVGPDAGVESLLVLGDLVLCPTIIEAEARAQGKRPSAHWAHLIVHGVLHLCGLDHEDEPSAAAMECLEIRLLSSRDLPDPYGDRAASS